MPLLVPHSSRFGRPAAFVLVGAVLAALMFAAGAPSPLYVVYQGEWQFSAGVLTTVFAVYAVFLLFALLTVGSLSDFVGRRPVLIGSLLLEAAAMLLFAFADGVGWLFLARAVQGFATGAATGAVSAALLDHQPRRGPGLGSLVNGAAATGGLTLGALGSGLLVQYAPAPTTLVFYLLAAVFLAGAATLLRLPETVPARAGALASLRPRMRIPRGGMRVFLAMLPALVAIWAVMGLQLSLGGSLAAAVLGVGSHFVAGALVAVFTGASTVGALVMRSRSVRSAVITGTALLVLGMVPTLVSLSASSLWLFLAGSLVAGFGTGAAFFGALKGLGALAAPEERAELFAAVYVVNYLAFGVPAVIAGFAVPRFGLEPTAVVYGAIVALLSLAALVATAIRRTGATSAAPATAAAPAATATRVPQTASTVPAPSAPAAPILAAPRPAGPLPAGAGAGAGTGPAAEAAGGCPEG
ncbi:MFS transporter [Phaeacidiphilus oryzae]|uniref:MFS transporter n=1 Tax=Phaeacidiphilus oryzae TaxID=348818 RepID=UPI0006922BA3|nr:MFS transporter [Phaeacidiphilus oryzae]